MNQISRAYSYDYFIPANLIDALVFAINSLMTITKNISAASIRAVCLGGLAAGLVAITASVASADIVTGADNGVGGHIKRFDNTFTERNSFFAFPDFTGGVRVAAGDVNGDGHPELIGAITPNGHVRVFDGRTNAQIQNFFAYNGLITGNVFVGTGDVNGDNRADIITASSLNGHVKVFDSQGGELRSFFAFDGAMGELSVAGGDINGDGFDDILTAAGTNGHVRIFDGQSNVEILNFMAFQGLTGSAHIAAGDLTGDGICDIIVGSGPGSPGGHVKVFNGVTGVEEQSFFAFPGFTGGVRVAVGDVNGDGFADIITGAGPGGSAVRIFDGQTRLEIGSFIAYDGFNGGVFVSFAATAIPEPSAFGLSALVLSTLGLFRRRSRQHRQR